MKASSPSVRCGARSGSAYRLELLYSCVFCSFHAIDDAAVNVGENEKDHAAKHRGDEEFVEQINVVDDGVILRAGAVVTHPCCGEVGGCIGVTALTFDEQVFLHGDAGFGVVGA